MAAMLVVKNNSLSLRWELNFIFMQILRKKKKKKWDCIDHQHGRLVTWLKSNSPFMYDLGSWFVTREVSFARVFF